METYCWCIMPSHLHLIFKAKDNNPDIVLGRFKEFTAKSLVKLIDGNTQESRKEWLLWFFKRAGSKAAMLKAFSSGNIIINRLNYGQLR